MSAIPNDETTKKTKATNSQDEGKSAKPGEGEAAGRERGFEEGGGEEGNDLLEDGQLRGVDADGNITGGTHGGPARERPAKP